MSAAANIDGPVKPKVPGITERERPISTGFCGNDHCEHQNHKNMRAAQAAADNRRRKK